jgi:hypothetical protein
VRFWLRLEISERYVTRCMCCRLVVNIWLVRSLIRPFVDSKVSSRRIKTVGGWVGG